MNHRGEVRDARSTRDGRGAAIDRLLAEGVESIAICFLHAYANGGPRAGGRRDRPRARARRGAHALLRDPARDARVRAHEHRGHQRLRDAGDGPLPRPRSRASCARSASRAPILDHAVERRRHDRRGAGAGGRSTSSSRGPPPGSSRPPRWPAGSAAPNAHQHRHGRDDRQGVGHRGRRDPARRRVRDRRQRVAGQPAQQGLRASCCACPPSTSPRSARAAAASSGSTTPGQLHVGPAQRGRDPGPGLLRQGGTEATLTDANVCLGYLHAERLPSGLRLDADAGPPRPSPTRSRRRSGSSLEDAAHGVYLLGAPGMARAVRAVTDRARPRPARVRLVAFGGNGPLFAAEMARSLGIGTVLVPPAPGVFSAVGLLEADLEHHLVRTFLRPLDGETLAGDRRRVRARWRRDAPRSSLARGRRRPRWRSTRSVDLRYTGQSYELTIPLPAGVDPRRRAPTRWPRRSRASTSGPTATLADATRSSS